MNKLVLAESPSGDSAATKNGKGAYWKSEEQINSSNREDKNELAIFNFIGWIDSTTDLDLLMNWGMDILRKRTNADLTFNSSSLDLVDKIKIKDVVKDKDLFYAVIMYSCGYYAHNYGGRLAKDPIPGEESFYTPVVIAENERNYSPYLEYLKSYVEMPRISIKQSIEIESNKYKFFKD